MAPPDRREARDSWQQTPSTGPAGLSGGQKAIVYGLAAVVAILGAIGIWAWLRAPQDVAPIEPRLPGAEVATAVPPANAPAAAAEQPAAGPQAATTAVPGAPAATPAASSASVPHLPGAWPCFRGANRDNISTERTALASSWGPSGPARLWSVALGEGYAGAAVLNGRVYVLDYDQAARADKLRCLSLADGKELWSQSYAVEVKRNHGFSRTVPAVTGKYVVTLGPKCHVMCCDAVTGKVIWKMDLVSQWGTTVPEWYAGQCPLIDGSRVILAPGGKALLIAVDLASGRVVWQSPNPRGWTMTHTSIAPMSFGGKRMYVYAGSGGVAGVSADDGSILWETTEWVVSTATVPTPVPVGDGRIFLCGGYNSGAMMIQLEGSAPKMSVKTLFRLRPNVFGSDQQTPILHNGHIYGVIPGGQLACLDLSGKQLWKSGNDRYGLGPYAMAGGMLYVLAESGELVLVKADPAGYQPLARAKILAGPEAWGPIAIAGGRLIARDLTNMVCVDIAKR